MIKREFAYDASCESKTTMPYISIYKALKALYSFVAISYRQGLVQKQQ